jgi:DNA sulfur modification protein DndB
MHEPLSLPAICGTMGNWTFYSAVMPMVEMAKRINYAEEIHTNPGLSNMIQRKLSGKRADEICQYLTQRPDRFFNSLVIAFYDGPPTWFSGAITPSASTEEEDNSFDIEDIRESGSRLGVLQLTGREKLFALDGQHRLSGIKSAYKKNLLPLDDCVPVIFVGHSNTKDGIRRSREIFTTLNKEAKKVGVGDIIALDENDPAAIITRMIVECETGLSGGKVAYKQTEAIDPRTDLKCVTTIANIYFSILNVFRSFHYESKTIRQIAALPRPDDEVIKVLFRLAESYFAALGNVFSEFGEAMHATSDAADIIAKNRDNTGGHILFRPVGITIFTNLVCQVKSRYPKFSIEKCVKRIKALPVKLNERPYLHLLWEPRTGKMRPRGKKVIIDLLAPKLGLPAGKYYRSSMEEYKSLTKEEYK